MDDGEEYFLDPTIYLALVVIVVGIYLSVSVIVCLKMLRRWSRRGIFDKQEERMYKRVMLAKSSFEKGVRMRQGGSAVTHVKIDYSGVRVKIDFDDMRYIKAAQLFFSKWGDMEHPFTQLEIYDLGDDMWEQLKSGGISLKEHAKGEFKTEYYTVYHVEGDSVDAYTRRVHRRHRRERKAVIFLRKEVASYLHDVFRFEI